MGAGMKIDQNKPEMWMVIGLVLVVVGVILRSAESDTGVGWFAIGAGALLFIVGLIIFAVRAGTSRGPDDGVG